ncbi:TetR/AcrR family transcriptional regulator [Hymenobacter terrenus]|uniref:TetR/AcrR family transcriptional regulator n=1 Tax=Hymenobacter terrenus TaxID=1629124 RepID=UPI000619299C|nr:TetR/AcrR family transcriptional regulator [Hymenobacter terrenus]
MGIRERKEREKTERRQAILMAAQRLFNEQGFEKVSMRNIAETIEYSPATIYLYFKNKNELLFALQSQAFGQLARSFESVFAIEHPAKQLEAVGHKYLEFAFQHPELFELMFVMNGPMQAVEARGETTPWASGRAAFERVVQVMQHGIDAGVFTRTDNAETAALMAWSQVHGLATLYLRKRMMIFPEDRRQAIMEEVMALFAQVLQHGL